MQSCHVLPFLYEVQQDLRLTPVVSRISKLCSKLYKLGITNSLHKSVGGKHWRASYEMQVVRRFLSSILSKFWTENKYADQELCLNLLYAGLRDSESNDARHKQAASFLITTYIFRDSFLLGKSVFENA